MVERKERSGATISQNDAVKDGAVLVASLRRLLRSGASKDKQLQKAFGVGLDVKATVSSVEKALGLVIAAASRNEAAVRAAGVLPDDITSARNLLAAVGGADASQERKKLTAKQATAAASVVHARLADNLANLDSIAQASLPGAQAAQFIALIPNSPRKKAAPAAPS